MSDQSAPVKKYANEAERKKAYRERLKQELGLEKYLEEQRIKKQQQRAKAKTKQTQVKSEPKPAAPAPQKELKQSLITSFFKPSPKPQPQQKAPPTPSKRSILNIKPVLKIQERLNKEIQKAKSLEEELSNNKAILNVRPVGRPKKQLENIQPLHVKYESKKVGSKTVIQYLSKLKPFIKNT